MDKQFICDMCDRSFPSSTTLGTHRNSHTFPRISDYQELITKLREKIIDNRLTAAAAAEEIGISGATISRVLNHSDLNIRPTSLKKIENWVYSSATPKSELINSSSDSNNPCSCEASALLQMFKEFCKIDSTSAEYYKSQAEKAEAELAKVRQTLNSIIGS